MALPAVSEFSTLNFETAVAKHYPVKYLRLLAEIGQKADLTG